MAISPSAPIPMPVPLQVPVTANDKYMKPLDLNAIIQSNIKGWHELNAANPGLKQLTSATTAGLGPTGTGIVSAQTAPTSQFLQNPALTKTPGAVASGAYDAYQQYMNHSGAKTMAPGSGHSSSSGPTFKHDTSWFGRLINGPTGDASGKGWHAPTGTLISDAVHNFWQGVTHGVQALKKASDDSGGSWNPVNIAKDIGAGAKGLWEGGNNDATQPDVTMAQATGATGRDWTAQDQQNISDKVKKLDLLHITPLDSLMGAVIGMGASTFGRGGKGVADFSDDMLRSELSYIPGLGTALGTAGKIGLKTISKKAGEDIAAGASKVYANPATRTTVADQMAADAQAQAAAEAQRQASQIAPVTINTPPQPVAPTVPGAEATVTATANAAHSAAVADQLHLFDPPPGTETHITHTLHGAHDPEVTDPAITILPNQIPLFEHTIKHKDFPEPVTSAQIDAHITSLQKQAAVAKEKISDYRFTYLPNAKAAGREKDVATIERTIAKKVAEYRGIYKDIKYSKDLKAKIPGAEAPPTPAVTPVGIIPGEHADDVVLKALKAQHDAITKAQAKLMSQASKAHTSGFTEDARHIESQAQTLNSGLAEIRAQIAAHVENLNTAASHATKDDIAAVAAERLRTGTVAADTVPSAEERIAARLADSGGLSKRDKHFQSGRPAWPERRNADGTKYKGNAPDHTLHLSTQDMANAGRLINGKAIAEADKLGLTDQARIDHIHAFNSHYLEAYKRDAHILGHDPQLGAQVSGPGAVSHKPDAYKLYGSDVYQAAVKHGAHPSFNGGGSAHDAAVHAIPHDVQLTAAVHALNLEKENMSEAAKVNFILKQMKRVRGAGQASGSKLLGTKAYPSYARAMLRAVPDLKEAAGHNMAQIVYKDKADTAAMVNGAIDQFTANMSGETASRTTKIETLADLGKLVDDAAAAQGGTSAAARQAAAVGLSQHVAQQGIGDLDIQLARSAKANMRDLKNSGIINGATHRATQAKIDARTLADHKAMGKEADDAIIPGLGEVERQAYAAGSKLTDLGNRRTADVAGDIVGFHTNARALHAVGRSLKLWITKDPDTAVRDLFRSNKSLFQLFQKEMNERTAAARQSIPGNEQVRQEVIKQAHQAWQTGIPIDRNVNPLAHALYNDFLVPAGQPEKGLISRVMEGPHGNPQLHPFMSHIPDNIAEANRLLDRAKVRRNMRFDMDAVDKTLPLDQQKDALMRQVHEWDFGDDPLAEWSKIHNVMLQSKQMHDAAFDATSRFGSNHKVDDSWTQVINTRKDPKEHMFSQHIPTQTWFPKDIAHQLGVMEADLRKGTSFDNDKIIGRFINETFDPVSNALRRTQTVLRPTSAVRNMMGDIWATHMTQGRIGAKSLNNAKKMMQSVGMVKGDEPFGMTRALQDPAPIGGVQDFLHVKLKGGATESLSTAGSMRSAIRNGMYQTSHPTDEVLEDVYPGAVKSKQLIGVAANKFNQAAPVRGMVKIADDQGTLSRLHQWDMMMRDTKWTSKFSSMKELEQATASKVRATHPDPEGLGNWERKYAKRAFGYYTWQRSMLMPMLMSLVANPRNMVLYPAMLHMFNDLAGSDPTSLGDQWSDQVNRPSSITMNPFGASGNMGGLPGKFLGNGGRPLGADYNTPVENLFGNSGLLTADRADKAVTGLFPKALGALNPLVKMPYELLTKHEIGDRGVNPNAIGTQGASDWSDYWDEKTPVVNQLANMSGYSPWGSISNLFSPDKNITSSHVPGHVGKLDRQASVEEGNKNNWNNTSTWNNFIDPRRITDPNGNTMQQQAMRELLSREGWGGKGTA